MEILTVKEIEIILEGLEIWETGGDNSGRFIVDVLGQIMAKNEEQNSEVKRERLAGIAEKDRIILERKPVATRIKIKLYDMRDELLLNEANHAAHTT